MSKRLLIETRMDSLSLCESKSKSPRPGYLCTISGPCADYDNPTRNNNFYSRRLWENVFKNDIVKESLEDRILIGELDHPTDRLETKATNACIVMTDYHFNDKDRVLEGTFDVLDTPNGRILKSLLDYGCRIGVSSRGEGDVETKDISTFGETNVVDEDNYEFVAFDAVVLPAVKAAKPSIQESLKRETLSESLRKEISCATTMSELNLIKSVVEATNLPDSDSLLESVNCKSQEIIKGTTGSSDLILEDLEKSNNRVQELNDTIRSLREDLTTCKKRIAGLMRSRQKLVSDCQREKKSRASAVAESNCLMFESSSHLRELESSREVVESLQTSLRDSEEEVSRLTQKIKTMSKSLEGFRRMISDKDNEITGLRENISRLEKESKKSLQESVSQGQKVKESLNKTKSDLKKRDSSHKEFVESYVKDRCRVSGVNYESVMKSVSPGMSKEEIDNLLESFVDRTDRYRSLTFSRDGLLESLERSSVRIEGVSPSRSPEVSQTADFMKTYNNLR